MLHIYNSLGKKLQVFRPVRSDLVTIFTCGPSVYQRAHIGNFRTFLFEDIVVRYLEFSGYKVRRGLNFTDIEDKAVLEARKEHTSVEALTEPNIRAFLDEAALLRMKRPDVLPRASRSVGEAVRIIEELLRPGRRSGRAYWHGGDVYFDPLTFPGFGRIYGLDLSRWPKKKGRFGKDTYPGMRWNLGDFILWHGCRGLDIECWRTRIGPGRPAWNIQDASMVLRHFDETLSIYAGGIDNLIRHHDYTRAILESVRPYPMARYWLHCRHLLVNGRKMSKSKGNILYTDDLLRKGLTPAEIRFFLIYNHYRREINYSERNMARAAGVLKNLREGARRLSLKTGRQAGGAADPVSARRLRQAFAGSMDNDLNVEEACDALLGSLHAAGSGNLQAEERAGISAALKEIDHVLQVIFKE